jgi:hypothetical protein
VFDVRGGVIAMPPVVWAPEHRVASGNRRGLGVWMGYYAVWPYFAGLTLICWLVSTAPFRALDAPPHSAGARVSSLDGLRGFLALSVVFSHVAVFHNLLAGGRWDLSPSRFYTMVGQAAVVLFFMVTSYLF